MKLKFKQQQFQIEAVNAVVDCFTGQANEQAHFTLDRGKSSQQYEQQFEEFIDRGFRNRRVELSPEEVFENIKKVQNRNGLLISPKLEGEYNLTIEMETGTGKTYTYIQTMFELHKNYGWSKFIIVVPSVAIREGVYKSLQMTEEHFMELYGKKVRYFIYNSKQLTAIEQFAGDAGINAMIINSQAFNARGKDARRIYMELDEFQTRKPIDVIAQTNPILIIDEPQSVEGKKTKESLKLFKPLFTLRYSATHKEEYNKIYRLDALDAYNKKLVKKINVRGITVKGSTATDSYLYLEGIDLSTKHYPLARLDYEVKQKTGVKRQLRKVAVNQNLYESSGYLEQYKGYVVSEINGLSNTIHFSNGVSLGAGDAQGDVNELNLRRIQIRETIKSHFEKEKFLFNKGIKVLSLFFIDEVARYRQYSKDGNKLNGDYAQIFEEEYLSILNEYISLFEDDYTEYLQSIKVQDTHNGYFSVDKQGRMIDSKVSKKENESDDVNAYDLIMKDKEKLLSFAEPTRFIFSHSALREGWDNPNVFQICTLKHSDSTIRKRQEVGRGLRLCVNQNGERIDASIPGMDVHNINVLTVVASESYESFAKELQNQIAESLSDRPRRADVDFFIDKVLTNERQETMAIDERLAKKIHNSFIRNNYLDDDDRLTEDYFHAVENSGVKLPEEFNNYHQEVLTLLSSIYSELGNPLLNNERDENIKEIKLSDNFYKKEFQDLWNKINVKTAYTVKFDTDELIDKCIAELDKSLNVSDIIYQVKAGDLERISSKEELRKGDAFKVMESKADWLPANVSTNIRYDLIAKLLDETKLTRKTIARILSGIKALTFALFQKNPEEFILKTARIINEQKATAVIERISYDIIGESYDTDIFTRNNLKGKIGENAIAVDKHVYDYVVTDSKTELKFARELDVSKEVGVYAKMPRGFFIPTPVGNYNPDWAIVFNEGAVKHIYFIAETKGSMDSLELRKIEDAKIHCAEKHFEKISNKTVKYGVVNSYEKLLEIVK